MRARIPDFAQCPRDRPLHFGIFLLQEAFHQSQSRCVRAESPEGPRGLASHEGILIVKSVQEGREESFLLTFPDRLNGCCAHGSI